MIAVTAAALFGFGLSDDARANSGGIRGVVYDAEFDEPVPGADIRIVETGWRTNTTDSGHFLFMDVPAGSYTLTISKPGFERAVQSSVLVAAGSLAEVSVRLRGEFTDMDELVVRDMELAGASSEVGLLNLRGAALTFQDSISKDLMSRAGAGDAASALKLVVGASVADGKYATIRGLSDRYVGTAFNGIRVPSSDPRKRAVHLDIFPAGTIDSMTVSKTFTPDLPGDYSGGGVNIRTVGVPEKRFFKWSVSSELNASYSGKDGFVTYDGGGCGMWGMHSGSRDMPPGAADMEYMLTPNSFEPTPGNEEVIQGIMLAMAPAMGTRITRVPDVNTGVSLGAGNRFNLCEGTDAGWSVAFTYGRKYKMETGPQADMLVPGWPYGSPYPDEVFDSETWTNRTGVEELKWSALVSAGLISGKDHEVVLTLLHNQAATDRAGIRISDPDPFKEPIFWEQRQAIHYTERSLDTIQLRGTHKWDDLLGSFAGLGLDWFGAHNIAEQEEPDIRYFRNFVIDFPEYDYYTYSFAPPLGSGTQTTIDKVLRIWRNTRENNSQAGVNVTIPFTRTLADSVWSMINMGPQQEPWGTREGKIRTGFVWDSTDRVYRQNTFWYQGLRQYTNSNPGALWTDVFTDPGYLTSSGRKLRPRTGAGPGEPFEGDTHYEGLQNMPSGYWLLDLPLTTKLLVSCGARLEQTDLTIDPEADRIKDPARAYGVTVRDPVLGYWKIQPVTEEAANVKINDADWLRSVNIVYDLAPQMKLRATWSQTIARPTLLELAPVINSDYVTGDTIVGNRDLKISHVVNRDLRWEWFPRQGEVLSASIFHKAIKDPIDRESFVFLSEEYLISVNLPVGIVQGWEVEARKDLDFLPDLFRHFSVGANYTFISAGVQMPPTALNNYAADDSMLKDLGLKPGPGNTVHSLGQEWRDMEGQPDLLWNLSLSWDNDDKGASAGLFYSYRGDMLRSGASITDEGRHAIPNTYTKGVGALNFSFSQKFATNWKLTLSAKNLLDPSIEEVYRFPDGTEVQRKSYREGPSYGVSIGATW